MNFETGSALADFQQSLFEKLQRNQSITPVELSRLEGNYWIKAAETMAPNNLVIRHYCLIDIIKKQPGHFTQIFNQINKLSYSTMNKGRIYAEGYSYWNYIKPFLNLYSKILSQNVLICIINEIDQNFFATSYPRGNLRYPAPFGDLRNVPLDPELQTIQPIVGFCNRGCVLKKSETSYTIYGWPVGLNPHVPAKNYDINIVNGSPEGFKFYTGYDQKYPSIILEWADMLNPRRIFSFFKW
jgi:hypothetical protein